MRRNLFCFATDRIASLLPVSGKSRIACFMKKRERPVQVATPVQRQVLHLSFSGSSPMVGASSLPPCAEFCWEKYVIAFGVYMEWFDENNAGTLDLPTGMDCFLRVNAITLREIECWRCSTGTGRSEQFNAFSSKVMLQVFSQGCFASRTNADKTAFDQLAKSA